MHEGKECQSYIRGSRVCKSGFFIKGICMGLPVGCHACSSVSVEETPNCQKDDLPDHWINENGEGAFQPI